MSAANDDMSSHKQDTRRDTFKKSVDVEESRRKREDLAVSIRKNKRDAVAQKRRKEFENQAAPLQQDNTPAPAGAVPTFQDQQKLANIALWAQQVLSDDPVLQLEGTSSFRRLLSVERTPPIQPVLDSGVVPRLVQFLHLNDNTNLQFEAAWALTNIASGTPQQTRVVIENGAVPIFVQLLSSASEDVKEQAVWALGNIAGDSPLCRDFVLAHGAIAPLINILQTTPRITMKRNATWTLSNFCRGKPQPPMELIRPAYGVLAEVVNSSDDELLTDACWAFSYLSDGPYDRIQAVIQAGVIKRMVELLTHHNPSVQTPALRTIGNIVTGDDVQTQMVIHVGVLSALERLLKSNKKTLRKEACWTISNITAGNKLQIQAVIDKQLFPTIIALLASNDFDVRKEAAWAVSNATSGGTRDQLSYLVQHGCLTPMCELLDCSDSKIIMVVLEGLDNILRVAQVDGSVNRFAHIIMQENSLRFIEDLLSHEVTEIYTKAQRLIDVYFSQKDAVDASLQPQAGNAQFAFGMNPQQLVFNFGNNFTS